MATPLLRLPPPPQPFLSPPTSTFPQKTHHRRNPITPFSSSPSFRNGRTPPETECPVPLDQQPVNEYQSLSTSFPFNWGAADLVEYCSRLLAVGSSFAVFVGLPVAWLGSVGPQLEPLKPALAAVSSGLFVVTLAVVRMYLGWSYVGNRLLSATVECALSLSYTLCLFLT